MTERESYRLEVMKQGRIEGKFFRKMQQKVFEATGIFPKKRHISGSNYLSINKYSPEVDKVMKEFGWKEEKRYIVYTHIYCPDFDKMHLWLK